MKANDSILASIFSHILSACRGVDGCRLIFIGCTTRILRVGGRRNKRGWRTLGCAKKLAVGVACLGSSINLCFPFFILIPRPPDPIMGVFFIGRANKVWEKDASHV